MDDVILGLLALAVGVFLCLFGQWALRILLTIWGAFVGFSVGAGLVSAIGGDGFLTTAVGWTVGFFVAIPFAALAYLYYAVGIVLSMAAMGFVLGGTLASALGAEATWLITLVGLACGALLAVVAVAGDLPQMLLIVLSSLTGASLVVGGLMLIVGAAGVGELTSGETSASDHPFWYLAFLVLAVVGLATQLVQAADVRGTVRESWAASPNHH